MKRKLFVACFLVAAPLLRAQYGHSFGAGLQLNSPLNPSVNKFIDGFNKVNQLGDKGLSKPRLYSGFGIDYRFEINKLFADMSYTQSVFGTRAAVSDGDVRHLRISNRTFEVASGGIIIRDKFNILIGCGMGGGKSIFRLFVKMRDGSTSYGHERVLNGTYSSVMIQALLKTDVVYKLNDRIHLFGNLKYAFTIPGTLFNLNDDNIAKAALGPGFKGAYQLPEDYESWLAMGEINYSLDYRPFVKADWRGPQLNFGIRYQLVNK